MRRFLPMLAGITAVLITAPAPAMAATTAAGTAAACVSAGEAAYRHVFDGAAGKVTVTASRALCSGQRQDFSLVSYTAGAPGTASGQFIYDSESAAITSSRRSVTLDVAVPACFFQVNAFVGGAVRTETTSGAAPHGGATLGAAEGIGGRSKGVRAWHAGGGAACTATPTVTFANSCDGTFTATLANGKSANTQAIFLVGERRIRLSAGKSTTVRGGRKSTLTIRASNFTTYVGTWGLPNEPCAAPTRPAPAQVASPTTGPGRGTVTPGPTISPSAPASGSGGGMVDAATYDGDRIVTASPAAAPVAQVRTGGMGAGSILVIVLGLLMIGGGLTVLTKVIRGVRGT